MRTFIYKLTAGEQFYIGSTTQDLRLRLSQHKHKRKGLLRTITDWSTVSIKVIEEFECETKDDQYKKESEYITSFLNDPCCLNRRRPVLTEDQRKEPPKPRPLYKQQYWEAHKEVITASRRQEVVCDCGATVSKWNIARHKRSSCKAVNPEA